jgi:galactokinase
VEPNLLEANRARLSASEYRCARYVTEEIQRAAAGERALQLDDHVQFGQYLYQSHDGARALLRHGSPELDALVELARGKAGCLGARLLAGSDARATINLVAHHQADEFRQRLASEYERKTGQKVLVDVCPGVDGAG